MKRFIASAGIAILVACGGGGGGRSSSPTPPPPPVVGASCEGIWTGSVVSSGTRMDATAIILASGEIHMMDSIWLQATGTTQPVGSSPITGSGTMYAPINKVFPGSGKISAPFTLTGSLVGGVLVGSFAGGDTGTFSFSPMPKYAGAVDLSKMAGSYVSISTSTAIPYTMVLTATGAFTGKDSNGGTFAGTLTPVDPLKNGFRVSTTYTTNEYREYPVTGIGLFDLTGASPKLLIPGVSDSGNFGGWFLRTGP